jgi:hypothetical protein
MQLLFAQRRKDCGTVKNGFHDVHRQYGIGTEVFDARVSHGST